MAISDWSTTPSDNATAPGIDWSEGMSPAQINNSARQMMADLKTFFTTIFRIGPDTGADGAALIYSDGANVTFEVVAANSTAAKRKLLLAKYGGDVGIGTIDGADYGRNWRFVAVQTQNTLSQFGFINASVGDAAGINLARINGLAEVFCDWQLNNNAGAAFDQYLYGSAVGFVRWVFAAVVVLSITKDGAITTPNRADAVGYKSLPAVSDAKGSTITLALSHFARKVRNTAGGWNIPLQATVAWPDDTSIVLYNESNAAQSITITAGGTLRLAGTTTTGTRTLAPRGYCVLNREGTDEWVAQGNVT